MNSGDSEEHPLQSLLLNERLPTLGLDAETYGPYIVALFPISNTPNDDDDIEEDIDGWDEILELLQASSELPDLEESVWEQFKGDLLSTWQTYRKQQLEHQKAKLLEKEQHLQKMLELERDIATMNAEAKVHDATTGAATNSKNTSIDDTAKRALLNRFGYEEDSNDDDGGGGKGVTDTSDTLNNNITTTKQLQHPPVTTKREEQQKTKAAQQQKIDAKEERRKRAVKGERRR